MNRIQKNRLLSSKWTALAPRRSEKHFIVTRTVKDDAGAMSVVLEAIHSNFEYTFPLDALKDSSQWRQGWH